MIKKKIKFEFPNYKTRLYINYISRYKCINASIKYHYL